METISRGARKKCTTTISFGIIYIKDFLLFFLPGDKESSLITFIKSATLKLKILVI